MGSELTDALEWVSTDPLYPPKVNGSSCFKPSRRRIFDPWGNILVLIAVYIAI